VTSKSSLLAAATTIASQTPFINTLIANAGIAGPADGIKAFETAPPSIEELQAHLWSTTEGEANSVSNINITASHFTFLAFLKLLDAGNTHIDSIGKAGYVTSQFIATSSIAGFIRNNIVGYPYSASKAALTHYTKMLATEFAPYKIRANTIAPGFFRTEATEFMVEGVPQEVDLSVPGNMPGTVNTASRAGNEEDVAGSVLYLVSRAGGFVNGAVLLVDGGAVSIKAASY
jgi:NAD(P)-dependent dehydrogenase (short-subunit alcohol dehydrogenase family)